MPYLIDTNIISELCRHNPDANVLAWANKVARVSISVISVDEIVYGLTRKPNVRVLTWMQAFFKRHNIIPISEAIAYRGGELRGQLAARGIICHQADMLIAATADVHGLSLVTRNIRDFEHCNIVLINPFNSQI